MEHQQWERINIGNIKKKEQINSKIYNIMEKKSDEEKSKNAQNYKIENETENFEIPKIPKELCKEIIQLRTNNKLNQKDFAQKLNIQVTTIHDIESGKAIYNGDTKKNIQKIEKMYKINFVNKK